MTLTNRSLHMADELEQKLTRYTELEAAYVELIEYMFNAQLQTIEQE